MGDLKPFDLQNFIKKYNNKVFIETGTLYGDGINYVKDLFSELHSIEIDPVLAQRAQDRFKDISKITIHCGKSNEILSSVLNKIDDNILFWLDAHFPSADSHRASYSKEKDKDTRAPLEKELTIISKRNTKYKDIIIIDDLWLYEDGPFEWGDFDSHSKACNMNVTRKELMGEISSDFVYRLFKETHNIKKIYKNQGYFIIYPKE